MPERFRGHRLPPGLYAQPLEIGVAVILLTTGIAMVVDPKYAPMSIAALTWPWDMLFRVLIISAGVLMMGGLLKGKHRWSFTAELTGVVMASTVFFVYAAGLYSTGNAAAWLSIMTNLVVACCCLIKARALWIEAQNRLQLIKELPLPDKSEGGGN